MSRASVERPAVSLRAARSDDEDAARVLLWRNDPVTLAASFHGATKVWPAFRDEYLGYFDAPLGLGPQFGVVDGQAIGFVRYRRCAHPMAPDGRTPGAVDISINVAPGARGRGLGRALIEAASDFALRVEPVVLAEIRPGNQASVRAFLAAGYARIDDGMHDVDGALVPVERYLIVRSGEARRGG